MPYIKEIHDPLNIPANPNYSKNNLYHIHLMFKLFLTKGQYDNLNNSIELAIHRLFLKVNSIDPCQLLEKIGFSNDWINKYELRMKCVIENYLSNPTNIKILTKLMNKYSEKSSSE